MAATFTSVPDRTATERSDLFSRLVESLRGERDDDDLEFRRVLSPNHTEQAADVLFSIWGECAL